MLDRPKQPASKSRQFARNNDKSEDYQGDDAPVTASVEEVSSAGVNLVVEVGVFFHVTNF